MLRKSLSDEVHLVQIVFASMFLHCTAPIGLPLDRGRQASSGLLHVQTVALEVIRLNALHRISLTVDTVQLVIQCIQVEQAAWA